MKLAQEAIALEKDNPNAYKCAGNALMSLERYDEAIRNYSLAVKYDPNNGNRYYDLGFAQATNEKVADALKSFAKADELGCIAENTVQLYNLLGIICFDIGRYDDALINLTKAEQLIGADIDILQRKAIIYGIKNDIKNGLQIANQIKLIAPSEYIGYKIAFKLLIQAKRLDTAKVELQKAAKFTTPTMDFYFDQVTYELEVYNNDKDKKHFHKSLEIIETALKTVKPEIKSTMESYINAAEIYLQLEDADKTIECLNAAQAPVDAYNNGFDIIDKTSEPPAELDDYAVEEMMEADRQKMEEELGEYGLQELFENTVPNEDGQREFFTEIEEEPMEAGPAFKLEDSEQEVMTSENKDQINRLYIGAYTLKKDFANVINYAKVMQASENTQSVYIGKYTEVNALKELGADGFIAKYEELIRFFRNAMIKDPTDIMAFLVVLMVQQQMDLKHSIQRHLHLKMV
ncbi:MAG: tetratricopeptide repeat protein [Clostridiales bacterium]|nr:tetratricopeptide repeat protein [Clostridiales bacterium]